MRFGIWEFLIIALLVILLFGARKIPELAKNIAEGIKVFKEAEKKNAKKTTKKKSK